MQLKISRNSWTFPENIWVIYKLRPTHNSISHQLSLYLLIMSCDKPGNKDKMLGSDSDLEDPEQYLRLRWKIEEEQEEEEEEEEGNCTFTTGWMDN